MIFYLFITSLLHFILNVSSLNSNEKSFEVFSQPPSNSPISKVFIYGKPYYIRNMKTNIRDKADDLTLQTSIIKNENRFPNNQRFMRDYVIQNPMNSYLYQPPSYPSPPQSVINTNYERNITTYATTASYTVTKMSTTVPPAPKKNNDYPLESCYTNKSGFMCCNEELEQLIYKTFNDLVYSRGGKWNKCNIQEIANKIQKNAQSKFDLDFESIAGIGDFASKSNFYGDNICKVEISGRYMLAYASPVQKPKMFENPDSLPYHKIRM